MYNSLMQEKEPSLALKRTFLHANKLSNCLADQLLSSCKIVESKKNNELIELDEIDGINFIIEGTLVLGINTPNLRTVNYIVLGSNENFGDFAPDKENSQPFFLHATKPIKLLNIGTGRLQTIANNSDEIYRWLHELYLAPKNKWLQSQLIMREPINVKLAYLLLELLLHTKPQEASETSTLQLSQQTISHITGVTRQRINLALKEFEQGDILNISRNSLTITDIDKLAEILNDVDLSFRDPRKLISL